MKIEEILNIKATQKEIIGFSVDSLLCELSHRGYLTSNKLVIGKVINEIVNELKQAEKDISKNYPKHWLSK